MEADLRRLIDTVRNPYLRQLLDALFGEDADVWQRFRSAPAAKFYHQAYLHGLLEHSLSVGQAVSVVSTTFPGVDRDVAVTGALIHDIGKIEAYASDPFAIDLTDDGKLLGEIPLGYYIVRTRIERIAGFPADLARRCCTSCSRTTGRSRTAVPSRPAHARRRSCTRSTTSVASWARSTGWRRASRTARHGRASTARWTGSAWFVRAGQAPAGRAGSGAPGGLRGVNGAGRGRSRLKRAARRADGWAGGVLTSRLHVECERPQARHLHGRPAGRGFGTPRRHLVPAPAWTPSCGRIG